MNTPKTLPDLLLIIAAKAGNLIADGHDGFRATMPGTTEPVGIGEFDLHITRHTCGWTTRVTVTVDGHIYWDQAVQGSDYYQISKAWRALDARVSEEREEREESVVRQFAESLTDLPWPASASLNPSLPSSSSA